MNLTECPCPRCGFRLGPILSWARATSPNLEDRWSEGRWRAVLDDVISFRHLSPWVQFHCGGCGGTITLPLDFPLAEA